MLDSTASELVDTIARLCVLRTEDYTLTNTVFKRERHARALQLSDGGPAGTTPASATEQAYIRYLTDEVESREEHRRVAEQQWCASVRRWATSFQGCALTSAADVLRYGSRVSRGGIDGDSDARLSSPPIWQFWHTVSTEGESGTFHQMYAGVVQQTYELVRSDLTDTPFAQLSGSRSLYAPDTLHRYASATHDSDAADAVLDSPLEHLPRIHELFFSPTDITVPPPSQVLAALHPVHDGDTPSTATRARLTSSWHVWLVLFFLWSHVAAASGTLAPGTASPMGADGNAAASPDALLIKPALAFLDGQAQQLAALLVKVRAMCTA